MSTHLQSYCLYVKIHFQHVNWIEWGEKCLRVRQQRRKETKDTYLRKSNESSKQKQKKGTWVKPKFWLSTEHNLSYSLYEIDFHKILIKTRIETLDPLTIVSRLGMLSSIEMARRSCSLGPCGIGCQIFGLSMGKLCIIVWRVLRFSMWVFLWCVWIFGLTMVWLEGGGWGRGWGWGSWTRAPLSLDARLKLKMRRIISFLLVLKQKRKFEDEKKKNKDNDSE